MHSQEEIEDEWDSEFGRTFFAFIQPKVPKNDTIERNVSALTQVMPQKCKDPGTFVIPCTTGDSKLENCMINLGASINVMPTSIYNNLDLGL